MGSIGSGHEKIKELKPFGKLLRTAQVKQKWDLQSFPSLAKHYSTLSGDFGC
jgi:hypothetical protein